MTKKLTLIIGIAGASASGKSLLANALIQALGSDQVTLISEDSYYKDCSHLPEEQRSKVNFDHPESLDHALLKEHLSELRQGHSVDIPLYDYNEHIRRAETRKIQGHAIIILEGILLFSDPALFEQMDIRIFVDAPLDVCLTRRLKRDLIERGRTIDSVLEQYETTVRPMYFQFVEPSKRHADIIVPRGGKNHIAIDMITAKMRHLLNQNGDC